MSNDQLLEFSSRDMAGIDEISKQDDVFSLLSCSLCPTIYGQDMVKVLKQHFSIIKCHHFF